jgi:hypothetical protein
MSKSTITLFLLLFLVQLSRAANAKACYFPDKSVAENDTACTSDTVSICCQAGATCLDNGLCFDPDGSAVGGYIRGSCTDKTWASSSCPQYCTYGESSRKLQVRNRKLITAVTDNATAGLYNSLSDAGVVSCGNDGFCCESDPLAKCDCQTGDGIFTISGDLKPFTTIFSSASTKSSAKTTSTKVATTTTSGAGTTLSKTTSTSSASSSPTNTSSPASSNNTALKVGLGVGLPLGCALVGVLGVLSYFLRRRQRQQKAAAEPDPSSVQFIPPTGPTEYYKPDATKVYEAPGSETFPAPQRAPTQIYEAPATEVYRNDHEMPA